jgi:hypothetical protein
MDQPKRSTLLEALCILSYAGNGIAFVAYLSASVFNHAALRWIREWSSQYDVSDLTPVYFLAYALLYAISFMGVLSMWKLKRSGFWLYLFSQSAILLFPSIWFRKPVFPSVVVIFTLLFIVLYAKEMFIRRLQSLEP